MRKSGNSDVEVCSINNLKIKKGEIFFERLQGIGEHMDKPVNQAESLILSEIEDQLNTYEPRIEIDTSEFENVLDENGEINLDLIIKKVKENNNE